MPHEIRAGLRDLQALESALNDLRWYTGAGGYELTGVSVTGEQAVWELAPRALIPEAPPAAEGRRAAHPMGGADTRRTVEPGDRVIVETKLQQMGRRFGGGAGKGVEGVVFRVLPRGPQPHRKEGDLRARPVGAGLNKQTMPGAGEAGGR